MVHMVCVRAMVEACGDGQRSTWVRKAELGMGSMGREALWRVEWSCGLGRRVPLSIGFSDTLFPTCTEQGYVLSPHCTAAVGLLSFVLTLFCWQQEGNRMAGDW